MMIKPFATTLDPATSLENHTGSWRTLRPVNVFKLPPCNKQCPAGENIQQWLYYAAEGDYEHAWRILTEDNPMPACMGRVCYHTCEGKCNRGFLDESVGINSVERFLGDYAIEHKLSFKKPVRETGKKVLIIGAGPAGLSAAYHLRRFGHSVHIVEMAKQPGGMMRYGIPVYRLPRDILDAEIARITDMGVTIECGRRVEDIVAEKLNGKYDAVILGLGASLSSNVNIPSGDTTHILSALEVLGDIASHADVEIGPSFSSVVNDNYQGALMLFRHMIKCGSRNIGCILGEAQSQTTVDRLNALKRVLEENSITFNKDNVIYTDATFENGYKKAKQLISKKIDSLFAINDTVALGVIKYCQDHGINIPHDLKVAGYDDLEIGSMIDVPLTTVHQRKVLLGRKAAELLLQEIKSHSEPFKIVLAPKLTVRSSCGEKLL